MRRRGASAIEFALVLPVWIAFLVGSFEYAYYAVRASALEQAVFRAGRVGANTPFADDPAAAFEQALQGEAARSGLDPDQLESTVVVLGDEGDRCLVGVVRAESPGLTGMVAMPVRMGVSVYTRLEDQSGSPG